MIENNVQLAFRNFFPFILHNTGLSWCGERPGPRTHDDKEVRIAGLHSGRRRCVLVPHEVLCVDDSDYRVQLEITASLAF